MGSSNIHFGLVWIMVSWCWFVCVEFKAGTDMGLVCQMMQEDTTISSFRSKYVCSVHILQLVIVICAPLSLFSVVPKQSMIRMDSVTEGEMEVRMKKRIN